MDNTWSSRLEDFEHYFLQDLLVRLLSGKRGVDGVTEGDGVDRYFSPLELYFIIEHENLV